MNAKRQSIFDNIVAKIPGRHTGWKEPWSQKGQSIFNFLRTDRRPDIDAWINRLGADISHDDDIRAPIFNADPDPDTGDNIKLIPRDRYVDTAQYYHSVFHELTHWTGYQTRLDRMPTSALEAHLRGPDYPVFEEMIAEMGAAMLMAEFGLHGYTKNSVEYLAPLARDLEMSLPAFKEAGEAANDAVDYLMKLAA